MNWVDFVVLAIVIALLLAIIFFHWILPHLRHEETACRDCAEGAGKKGKRLLRDYHSSKKSANKNKDEP
jgi:hypothetical protein